MNFVETFKEGQKGKAVGLPMGKGLQSISRAIGGIQKGKLFTVAAAPKVGKSTLVDVGFVIEPCIYILNVHAKAQKQIDSIEEEISNTSDYKRLEELNHQYSEIKSSLIQFHIVYLSYEIDRVSKEFDFAAHFINRDYGIDKVILPEGKKFRGKNYVPLSSDYFMGQLVYDSENETEREVIKIDPSIEDKLKKTYKNRIIPLFGEYDDKGNKLKKGLITVVENRDNPTGIRNDLIAYAQTKGEFSYSEFTKDGKKHRRMIGYKPNNPNMFTLVVTDHIRKLIPERGFTLKQTVDKFSEYTVEFRNMCKFSFVHIVHLNRNMSDVQRRKLDDDRVYPTSDDIKETGNLSEDSNYIFTMFNPNDDRYNLNKHFGTIIRNPNGSLKYPNMRTIHLVESRHCDAPQHFRVNMLGGVKTFKKLEIDG